MGNNLAVKEKPIKIHLDCLTKLQSILGELKRHLSSKQQGTYLI